MSWIVTLTDENIFHPKVVQTLMYVTEACLRAAEVTGQPIALHDSRSHEGSTWTCWRVYCFKALAYGQVRNMRSLVAFVDDNQLSSARAAVSTI
jgi:hypothetical protein